jgi:hypothetical protein
MKNQKKKKVKKSKNQNKKEAENLNDQNKNVSLNNSIQVSNNFVPISNSSFQFFPFLNFEHIQLKSTTENQTIFTLLKEKYYDYNFETGRKNPTSGLEEKYWPIWAASLNKYLVNKSLSEQEKKEKKALRKADIEKEKETTLSIEEMRKIQKDKLKKVNKSTGYKEAISVLRIFLLFTKEMEGQKAIDNPQIFVNPKFLQIRLNFLEEFYLNTNTCKIKK